MIATIYDPQSGMIQKCVSGDLSDVQEMTGETLAYVEGRSNRLTHYVEDEVIVDRPAPDLWPGGPAPYTLDMEPEERVTVANAAGTFSTDDPADPFILTEPGSYEVTRERPFPWQTVSGTVEVTDA